ncbi:papilin-like [Anneissia japonica]|uniref:papilin-like n=1 Tax=Anneissia japonica TaxID=1529436 RepID=UPI00142578CB|nr:papilin-like [Anneissia japonica]
MVAKTDLTTMDTITESTSDKSINTSMDATTENSTTETTTGPTMYASMVAKVDITGATTDLIANTNTPDSVSEKTTVTTKETETDETIENSVLATIETTTETTYTTTVEKSDIPTDVTSDTKTDTSITNMNTRDLTSKKGIICVSTKYHKATRGYFTKFFDTEKQEMCLLQRISSVYSFEVTSTKKCAIECLLTADCNGFVIYNHLHKLSCSLLDQNITETGVIQQGCVTYRKHLIY